MEGKEGRTKWYNGESEENGQSPFVEAKVRIRASGRIQAGSRPRKVPNVSTQTVG